MSNRSEQVFYTQRAMIGFLFALPPLFFVTAAVLKYGLGIGFIFDPLASFLADPERLRLFNIISPILFLGGLIMAIALNLYPLLHFNRRTEDAVLTLTLHARTWNMLVVATSTVLLMVLVVYAFLENFTRPI